MAIRQRTLSTKTKAMVMLKALAMLSVWLKL